VNVSGKLTKPESKHNPDSRGTIFCQVDLVTLSYAVQYQEFFQHLPHAIQYWAIFLHTPQDAIRSCLCLTLLLSLARAHARPRALTHTRTQAASRQGQRGQVPGPEQPRSFSCLCRAPAGINAICLPLSCVPL
jgi:hypothetical protein